jgi:hypothetical protein
MHFTFFSHSEFLSHFFPSLLLIFIGVQRVPNFKFHQCVCISLSLWCSELSSGLYCRVKWLSTDVSEVRTASIIITCLSDVNVVNYVKSWKTCLRDHFFVSLVLNWYFFIVYEIWFLWFQCVQGRTKRFIPQCIMFWIFNWIYRPWYLITLFNRVLPNKLYVHSVWILQGSIKVNR